MRVNAVNEQLAFLRRIKAAEATGGERNRTAKIKLTSLTLSAGRDHPAS